MNNLTIINKAKDKICYWDKSIDMSKATLQVDGEIICKFDNDNQTVILVNEGFKTLREIELEARVKELEEQLKRKEQECEQIKEKYEALKLENQEGYEIVAELKHECKELKDKLKIYEKMFDNSEFRVALTDIRTGERDIREQRDKRLTKENEELKRKVELMMDCPDCKVDEYKKALEEIENYICEYEMLGKLNIKYILNIINKAKGEVNE